MSITNLAVKKPVTILIIFILILILGFYASTNLSLDLYPDINPPVLFVFTEYEGTSPEEMEKTVTRPLESALSNVSNIEEITSTTSEGMSQIQLEFTWGTDMSEASNEVRDKIEYIKDYLPADAKNPTIFKFDPSMIPIMYLGISGDKSPEDIRKIAEDIIQPRLEAVDGVALVNISGGREKIIRVEISQNRLEAYNLTLTQIAGVLNGQNIQISAGSIEEENKTFLINTSGEYKSIEEIKNTVIAYKNSNSPISALPNEESAKVVRLRDIANVYEGLKKETNLVYINGKPSVFLTIQKQSGKNSIKTADNVIKRLNKLKNEIPSNISINIIYDTTKIIRRSLSDVGSSAILGGILAILILFLFLRSFKSVMIIAISIPSSIIITLLLMYFFNFTLNVMTLAGLALGIGMLVDNSIVILENIYRYREKGTKIDAASILGSKEMIMAISASTLTTIVVFAPIAMFNTQLGMYGVLFSGMAFTVVFSLAASLLVAMIIVPVLTSKYLPITSKLERQLTGLPKKIDDWLENFWNYVDSQYKKGLKYVLSRRKLTILIVAGIFVLSLILIPLRGFQLMPQSDEDSVSINIELPIGTKLDITKSTTEQLEEIIKKEIKGYKNITSIVGIKSFHGFLGSSLSHKAQILIILDDSSNKKGDTSTQIKNKLRKYFNTFPDVIFTFEAGMRMGQSASPVDILIKSNDLKRSKEVAEQIKELLKKQVPEAVEPVISLNDGKPQIEIFIDRDKAYALGLNINTIGQEVRANIDGITASKYKEGANEYDILVIVEEKDRDAIPDLEKISVINNMGERIPLSSFAHLERTYGPVDITRENQMRVVHVTADIVKGKQLDKVEAKIRSQIKKNIPQDDDLIIDFSGDYAELMKYGLKLLFILLMSILLVFGIMASQFESFIDPFIILFTIPLSLIGVTVMYFITFEMFNILTFVGIIVLAGIVVNNGIVLVDYTNLLIKRGYSLFDACIEAGGNRLRPILMTTLTTILGLIPMAFMKVEGSELSNAIAKTILGGLTVSTIMTLFLIPVIYSIFFQFSAKFKEKREAVRLEKLNIRKIKMQELRDKKEL